ncbi:MAG: transketolase, partial [Candidatus Aminicenantes bacterium]
LVATFAAFLTRAHDQVRMRGCSLAHLKFVGSHVGVSIGADGPSQMGLEDIAMFRALPGGVVLYPCDAYSTEACLENLARYQGIGYLRTTRPATPLVYSRGEKFPIGGSKILRRSPQDKVLVVAAGITVFEALKAYDKLVEKGISVRIMDAYSVQPIDRQGLLQEAKGVGGKVVVVEDHYPAGGLGEAVAAALAGQSQIIHLAVSDLPRSGSPEELLDKFGLSASHIEQAVLSLLT